MYQFFDFFELGLISAISEETIYIHFECGIDICFRSLNTLDVSFIFEYLRLEEANLPW